MGCLGGIPLTAWQYAAKTGLVDEACLPYLDSEGTPVSHRKTYPRNE